MMVMPTVQSPSYPAVVAVQPLGRDRHPAGVYLAALSTGSRRSMRQALDIVAGILSGGQHDAESMPWAALRYQHTQAVRVALADRYAPSTANKALAALRGVLREAWRLGLMDAETYRRAADVANVAGSRLPAGRAISRGEAVALFRSCRDDQTAAGARDAALLAVLYGGGLRRAEAVALDLSHYDAEAGELRVRGKRNNERLVPLPRGAMAALSAWLDHRGDAPGPLFCPVDKGGKVALRRITAQAVMLALAKRTKQAGIGHVSPHDLRRSFITALLDAGADTMSVQRLAGHANVQTTARYDRRDERAKRAAVDLLCVPYD